MHLYIQHGWHFGYMSAAVPDKKSKDAAAEIPVAENAHEALQHTADPPQGWGSHANKTFHHAFVRRSSSSSRGGGDCPSCCEKPFDSPLADDLYVVHARWDNHLKQWIPVCVRDHDFGRPPFYYRYGGFETMDAAASWILAGIFLIVLVGIMAARSNNHHHGYYDDSSSSDQQLNAWPIALAGGLLLLMCTCAAGVTWWIKREEEKSMQWT